MIRCSSSSEIDERPTPILVTMVVDVLRGPQGHRRYTSLTCSRSSVIDLVKDILDRLIDARFTFCWIWAKISIRAFVALQPSGARW